jgi:hypothetical protein
MLHGFNPGKIAHNTNWIKAITDIVLERKVPMPMPGFEHWLLPVISLTNSLTCSYIIFIKINSNLLTGENKD